MANPILTAEQLYNEVRQVLEIIQVAPARKQDLLDVQARVEKVIVDLRHFNDEVAPVEFKAPGEQLVEAATSWAVIEPGVYGVGSNVLERQVTSSSTLVALYKAGITIRSIRKFARAEMDLAAAIGDDFHKFQRAWDRFKLAITHDEDFLGFKRSEAEAIIPFLDKLAQLGCVGDYGFQSMRWKDKSYVKTTAGRIFRDQNSGQPYRVVFDRSQVSNRDLLTGLWFDAYAAQVIRDHLERNEVDHEVYANVAYEAPRDVMPLSGDFDVLVRAGDIVVLLECKSGRLDPQRGDFEKVVRKAEGLNAVLSESDARFTLCPMLLYNHHLSSEEEVMGVLDGTIVQPVRLKQLRPTIRSMFSAA